jgi:hypothetical protein
MTESVKVIVRCRPLVEKEQKMNCHVITDIDKNLNQIVLRNPKE